MKQMWFLIESQVQWCIEFNKEGIENGLVRKLKINVWLIIVSNNMLIYQVNAERRINYQLNLESSIDPISPQLLSYKSP